MHGDSILFALFLIFTGAALLAALALHARQSMLVAYIALGVITGPHALALVDDPNTIENIGHVGIIFLLYLLGLNLLPSKLLHLLREATLVTLTSSAVFAGIGFLIARGFGFNGVEAALAGAAMAFSSTIIGLKLLPTTALHHRHIGEIIIAILLLQDVLAIFILVALESFGRSADSLADAALTLAALPALAVGAWAFASYVLHRLIGRFDTIQEFIFLIAIGWCLGVAETANAIGLSREMGAFIAGVALATSPIANYIADSLKPLRDFFLVMFFFSLGAAFDLSVLPDVALPALVMALAMLVAKPLVFRGLLRLEGEEDRLSKEIGVRLGQVSEFGLLIAVLAVQAGAISERTGYVITAATMITLVVSSYWIMMRYPTPIAVDARLRRD